MKKFARKFAIPMALLMVSAVVAVYAAELPQGAVGGASRTNGTIMVNGQQVQNATSRVNGTEGNILIPISPVARALGLSVEWRGESRSIVLGGNVEIWIGQTKVHIDGAFARDFGPAPEILDGVAYVSMPFFGHVLSGMSANIENGSVVINKMEVPTAQMADVAGSAAPTREVRPAVPEREVRPALPETDAANPLPEFAGLSGTVTGTRSVSSFSNGEESVDENKVMVEIVLAGTEGEGKANLIVDENTVLMLESEIAEGMEVTAFYDATLPMTMIYPPQYRAVAMASGNGILVDRFDERFTGKSSSAILDIPEGIEITLQDGTAFDVGKSGLANRALVVAHNGITTDGRVVPTKITVLFERAVPPIYNLTEEELNTLGVAGNATIQPDNTWQGGLQLTQEDLDTLHDNMLNPETVQVIVNGKAIKVPTPFVNRDAGFVMIPLAPVAEELGYTVNKDGDDLIIGRGSRITVGSDSYYFNRMAPVELGAAPEVVDGVVFVPLHFFGSVFPEVGYMTDGNVIIEKQQLETDIERN